MQKVSLQAFILKKNIKKRSEAKSKQSKFGLKIHLLEYHIFELIFDLYCKAWLRVLISIFITKLQENTFQFLYMSCYFF